METRTVLALIVCLFAAACTTTPPKGPLTHVFQATNTEAKTGVVTAFTEAGYIIVRDTQFQLIMDRPITGNLGASLVFGSNFNSTPNARVNLTFTGDSPTTVRTNLQVITNPNSGFEQAVQLTENVDARRQIDARMVRARMVIETMNQQ